jgi:hypothetical protein
MSISLLVRMENLECKKCLKTLERVKGIEPSYSAWKAAALPLSYTRAGDELSRRAGGLNSPSAPSPGSRSLFRGRPPHQVRPLTWADSVPILSFPSTNERR